MLEAAQVFTWVMQERPGLTQVPGATERMNVTGELFSTNDRLEQIPMPEAEVSYLRRFLPEAMTSIVLRQLIDEVPWRAENITLWGKTFPQPRLIAWYGDR